MGVITNLTKLKSCHRVGLHILRHCSESKTIRLNSKICNYVMQKQNLSLVLKKTSELQEIYRSKKKLSAVDLDLCIKVSSCGFNDVLVLLNSFVVMDFDYCMKSLFYKVFLENLKKGLVDQAKWDQLIQIIYYVAHNGQADDTKPLIINCLNNLNDRPEVTKADYRDICVVSEAAFKTDTIILGPNIRDRMKEVCKNDFYNLSADPQWLGMLFKGFRMLGKYDIEFLLEISDVLKRSQSTETFDLMTVKQLITLYSDALVKDEVLLDTFVRSSSKHLRKWLRVNEVKGKGSGLTVYTPRMKDLGRMLYSLTILDHPIDPRVLETVFVPCFLKLIKKRTGKRLNSEYEVTCLLSFWSMGYDLELIGDACRNVIEEIDVTQISQRGVNIVYKLLVIIALQYPKLLNKKLKEIKSTFARQDEEVTKIPRSNEGSLKFLKNAIDKFKNDFKVTESFLEVPVEASHLLGLSIIANGEKIHIDVMEKEFCVALTDEPNWIINYKLKLLHYVPKIERHIIIHRDELLKMRKFSESEIFDYLKNTIFENRKDRRELIS